MGDLSQAEKYEIAYWTLIAKETAESQRLLVHDKHNKANKDFIQRVIEFAEDPKHEKTLAELKIKKIQSLVDNPQTS